MQTLPPLDRTILWSPAEGIGLEHCRITRNSDGDEICGVIARPEYGLMYRLLLDQSGKLRSADLQRTDGKTLYLRSDSTGHWTDADATPLPDLDGCIDIDIWPTPLTNSLPIWRSSWVDGEPQRFSMAWVDGDAMSVRRDDQIYTRIDSNQFRYQAADRSFERVLLVDADGLVVEYPGLFTLATL
jgi:uncharacterized protein